MRTEKQKKYHREYTRMWREKNPERWKELRRQSYRRNRKAILERVKLRKEQNALKQRCYYHRHREQCIAQATLRYAVRKGLLERPKTCERCGRKGKIEGHHFKGYRKEFWLVVRWLCTICHGLETSEQHALD